MYSFYKRHCCQPVLCVAQLLFFLHHTIFLSLSAGFNEELCANSVHIFSINIFILYRAREANHSFFWFLKPFCRLCYNKPYLSNQIEKYWKLQNLSKKTHKYMTYILRRNLAKICQAFIPPLPRLNRYLLLKK